METTRKEQENVRGDDMGERSMMTAARFQTFASSIDDSDSLLSTAE